MASGIVPDNDCINKKTSSFSILQKIAYSYSASPLARERQPFRGKGPFLGKYQDVPWRDPGNTTRLNGIKYRQRGSRKDDLLPTCHSEREMEEPSINQ
jgi:hypothetical protein